MNYQNIWMINSGIYLWLKCIEKSNWKHKFRTINTIEENDILDKVSCFAITHHLIWIGKVKKQTNGIHVSETTYYNRKCVDTLLFEKNKYDQLKHEIFVY
jgi:hypothetical protein